MATACALARYVISTSVSGASESFVHTTVNHYRGSIQHWGMWNEPNFRHFFNGGPQQYISTILRVGSQAVRCADPSGYVLGPELAQEDGWWLCLYAVLG